MEEIYYVRVGKRFASTDSNLAPAAKRNNVKDHMDLHMLKGPEASNKLTMAKRQTSIRNACIKEARAKRKTAYKILVLKKQSCFLL